MNDEVRELIEERNEEYGEAWKFHGVLLHPIAPVLASFHTAMPSLYFAWNLIFNKLLRILRTPLEREHWLDIQGYAQLVMDEIDAAIEKAEADAEKEDEPETSKDVKKPQEKTKNKE